MDVFIFRQKEQKKHIFQILLFSEFHHKLQLTFAGKEIPTLPQRITSKGTKKRTKLRSDFAPKGSPKAKKRSKNKRSKNSPQRFRQRRRATSQHKKPRPQFRTEKRRSRARRKEAQAVWAKRVPALPTGGASQPVQNCRRRFFFLLPFSFCRQKEKVRASQKKK